MPQDWLAGFCSVGHPLLDAQHRQFLQLCEQARLVCDTTTPDGVERAHELLNELVQYAQRHFLTEESILDTAHYPDVEVHRAEHEAYRERLTEILLEATFDMPDGNRIFSYLSEWWRQHVLQSDMGYREHLLVSA